jgi:hypothetical protein
MCLSGCLLCLLCLFGVLVGLWAKLLKVRCQESGVHNISESN